MTQRYTIHANRYPISDQLHRRAQAQAALKGVALPEYLEAAIAAAVEADEDAR